ncbi:ATP-binding protein [Thalassobacillus sp. C254]|uniref:ATP-binding protein n=1 Tax=Thalassobacillus sp. C254 TaxID=1225341 RepID=UPI0006D04B3C|nr:ATP-binding protein [Thalassobacillus sp. C254]
MKLGERAFSLTDLTNSEEVKKGAHILYSFNEESKYIENAFAFIKEGLDKNHHVVFIDEDKLFNKLVNKFLQNGYSSQEINNIFFINNTSHYMPNNIFNAESNSAKLEDVLDQLVEKDKVVRLWGHVIWPEDKAVLHQLRVYECQCDKRIFGERLIVVCAYNGLTTSAYIQSEMMRTHEYLMMDDRVSFSPFYEKQHAESLTYTEQQRLIKIEMENKILKSRNKELAVQKKLIHEQKKTIEEREKIYRTLLNEIPTAMVITIDNTIVYANKQAFINFKVNSGHSFQGRCFLDFAPPEARSKLEDHTKKVNENRLIRKIEMELMLESEEITPFEIKSIPIWFQGDQAKLHVLVDLTQQKINERLMVRSEKLTIAGQLAAGIAHEIRNPLTAIKGFFQLLRHHEAEEAYYKIIEDELTKIEQISGELLILAKPHSDALKKHNITTIIDSIIKLLQPQASLIGVEILSEFKEEEMHIICEDSKIKQVFINLIKNSMETMDKGRITIKAARHLSQTIIQVVDEGKGMSPAIVEKIGTPFFTTKEKGTGLGLFICHKIVEEHHGSIKVDSAEGIGTTFTITLPLCKT